MTRLVIQEYLKPLAGEGIDCLVLGCTHYPVMQPAIARFLGPGVELISSSEAVAEVVEALLTERGELRSGSPQPSQIFLTDHSATFHQAMRLFLNGEVEEVELVDIPSAEGK